MDPSTSTSSEQVVAVEPQTASTSSTTPSPSRAAATTPLQSIQPSMTLQDLLALQQQIALLQQLQAMQSQSGTIQPLATPSQITLEIKESSAVKPDTTAVPVPATATAAIDPNTAVVTAELVTAAATDSIIPVAVVPVPVPESSTTALPADVAAALITIQPSPSASSETETMSPMLPVIKDIALNLIIQVPGLRNKLQALLDNPDMALREISTVYEEFKDKFSKEDKANLEKFIVGETTRTMLISILQTGFSDIMADGKVDMQDAVHFAKLVHNIVRLFNDETEMQKFNFTVSGDSVMTFLHFLIKSVLVLTLDGEEEAMAVKMIDTNFMLLGITVAPLAKMAKCKCCFCCCCNKKKQQKQQK